MACGISRYAFLVAVVLTDIVGVGPFKPEPPSIVETVPAVVVETAPTTEPTQTQHTQHAQSVETAPQSVEQTTESVLSDYSRGFTHYSIAGNVPPYEWEWYLYCQLVDRGVEWFYPYAVCQIWQESRWNAASTNGRDHGLCQQKGIYWDGRAANAGIPGADIWDPYAQLYVYSWMMSGYLAAAGNNVGRALSMYYLGVDEYSADYVNRVLGWMNSLEVVK